MSIVVSSKKFQDILKKSLLSHYIWLYECMVQNTILKNISYTDRKWM